MLLDLLGFVSTDRIGRHHTLFPLTQVTSVVVVAAFVEVEAGVGPSPAAAWAALGRETYLEEQ